MKKIPNVFVRDWKGDPSRVLPIVEPGSEWAINGEGVMTRKWDGAACLVQNGVLFKRYDAKKGKTPPPGFIPAQEPDAKTGHYPGWIQVDPAKPEDRYFVEAFGSGGLDDGTYECCGPKINGNPEGLDRHFFVPHGRDVVWTDLSAPYDYEKVKTIIASLVAEGIVFHHPDGRMAKVKRRDFGLEWPVRAATP